MRKSILTLTASGAVATSGATASLAVTNDNPPIFQSLDPASVESGSYATDPAHTLVEWRVSHFGFNDYFGLFGNITGTITMDPANVEAATFEIMIPVAEVTVASAGLKGHLLRAGKDGAAPDFFGPEPGMAKFTSTSVTKTGATSANVLGDLTLNGKTAPVMMAVDFVGAGANPFNKKETVGFHARAMMDRTQWGINYGVPMVSKDVELTISAAFEKQ